VGTLLYPFMLGKMQEIQDGWGMTADKSGFEHAGVSRDR